MKKGLKTAALFMGLVLVVTALAACGAEPKEDASADPASVKEDSPELSEITGTIEEYGFYRVFVPEGFTLTRGDLDGDETNEEAFLLTPTDASYTYFAFELFTEEDATSNVSLTKRVNDGAGDVSVTYNGVIWTGTAYDQDYAPYFSMYADFGGGHYVIATGAGNAYNSELTEMILSSLEVNVPSTY